MKFCRLGLFLISATLATIRAEALPNIVLIAVDDMLYNTPNSFGGEVAGLTPHIDSLADRGMRFTQAYNTSSRCAPSRGSMMTGFYQDGYNAKPGSGDTTVKSSILTLPELLKQKGYLSGLFGKDTHYKPIEKYSFDHVSPMAAMAVGRSPQLYAENVDLFIRDALRQNRPFFISVNTHDPHRPFAGAPGEAKSLARRFESEVKKLSPKPPFILPPKVEQYSGKEIEAPGFVPDHEWVREEFGYYLNSSRRADQFVGGIVDTLERTGVLDNTLVIFLSDNGIHWPFAKSNVYVSSVKTPMVMYWQGHTMAGSTTESLVSTIDLLPTILEATSIEAPYELPGKSVLPLLNSPAKAHHAKVFATLNMKGDMGIEMRSIIRKDYIYIYTKWANGETRFYDGKYSGGLALEGLEAAAKESASARERLEFFYTRTQEELYHCEQDPDALSNLLDSDKTHPELSRMRTRMLEALTENNDPYLPDFKKMLGERSGLVFHEGFESPDEDGLYRALVSDEHLEVVAGQGVGGGHALQTTYEGSVRGSERVTNRYKFGERGSEHTLNYDVKFDEDFQFVKGGKLHGLGPDSPITGGKPMRPDGWSARVTFKEAGSLRSYLYAQNKDGQYGTGVYAPDFHFEKENYYAVSLHVKLNEKSAESDGFAHIYINGKRVIEHDGVRFRGEVGEETLISTFLFSTFHGGHVPECAPRNSEGDFADVHAYFDNIAVYRGKNVRVQAGEG
tara:strand:- start:5964 stop:8159 length:2196 start_codon:yes stop_codon:yes gene_type:complete